VPHLGHVQDGSMAAVTAASELLQTESTLSTGFFHQEKAILHYTQS
jgi:hypothetical protein